MVSYGCVPASVKYRRIPIPICSGAMAMRLTPPLFGVSGDLVLRPQDIAVDLPSTTTCGGSLHHRNYGRVNGVPRAAGDVVAGQTGARKIPLVNLRTRPRRA